MTKKSILFIADKRDWAYHNIIKTWQLKLENNYDCFIAFAEDYYIRPKQFSASRKLIEDFRHFFFKKEQTFRVHSSLNYAFPVYLKPPVYRVDNLEKIDKTDFDFIIEMAYYFQYTCEFPFSAKKKLIGIYTDSFPHEGPSFDAKKQVELKLLSRKQFFENYLNPYDGIIVGNQNLFDDYKSLTDKLVIANGIFRQEDFIENQTVGRHSKLVIGWTGNPNRSMKGFKEVIQPAVEKVQKTGRDVELKTQFSGSYESLLKFYKDVDLICIASEADTGPSLFSEACLSNVPSISTKIGFPKMVIQDQINGVFVERDIDEMGNAIMDLYDNRAKLFLFSERIKSDYLRVLDNKTSIENLSQFLKTR